MKRSELAGQTYLYQENSSASKESPIMSEPTKSDSEMRFIFNETKTAQAAAHLLSLHGGKMNYMVLIKLLFLADRDALLHHGQPITGAKMISMKHGPVLSDVLDLINEGTQEPGVWTKYISTPADYEVKLMIAAPEIDELSRYELRVLRKVHDEFGSLDKWKLVDWLHENIPEWSDPNGSMLPISFDDVMLKNAVPSAQIAAFREDARVMWHLRLLLA